MNRDGFTLLEIMLALSISAFLMGAIAGLTGSIYSTRAKVAAVEEIRGEGVALIEAFRHEVRNADGILIPAPGQTGANLKLQTGTSTVNFRVRGGRLEIQRGSLPWTPFISNQIIMDPFLVQNRSRSGTAGIVRIEFGLSHFDATARAESEFEQSFELSAAIFTR
jgi:prepilin-type N-terminal cleavage/methylation domain-containing protein